MLWILFEESGIQARDVPGALSHVVAVVRIAFTKRWLAVAQIRDSRSGHGHLCLGSILFRIQIHAIHGTNL